MSEIEVLSPRHEGHHHTANVKYGYLVLGLSIVHTIAILVCKTILKSGWGRSKNNIGLVKYPLVLTIVSWSLILIGLGVYHIEFSENYTISIKRFGRMTYALLPFDIFLILRPNYFGLRYLEFIDLHKWISRLIIVGSSIHGIGYLIKWVLEGSLFTKMFKLWNFLGVLVFILNIILIIISVRFFRRKAYQYFYIVHNLTVWLFVGLIFLHARPGVGVFTIVCASLLALQIFERYAKSHPVENLKVIAKEGSSLIIVRLPRDLNIPNWSAGSHVRLTYPLTNYRSWIYPTHPYTIASSDEDSSLDLIVNTTNRFILQPQTPYSWSGPFPSLSKELLQNFGSIEIICGGSGISFALPVFNSLKSRASYIKLTWCIRNKNDLHVLRALKFADEITVHITGNLQYLDTSNTVFDEEDYGLLDYNNEDVELQSLQSTETPPSSSNEDVQENSVNSKESPKVTLKQGRPDLDLAFESLTRVDDEHKLVVACGPKGLVDQTKQWASANNTALVSEIYEM